MLYRCVFVSLLSLVYATKVQCHSIFLGGSIGFTLERNPGNALTVHVQVVTSWILGEGPCGPDCSLADISRSTLVTRREQEVAHANDFYFGNYSVVYRVSSQKTVVSLLDAMATTMSEYVDGVDEIDRWEQERMAFSFIVPSEYSNGQIFIHIEGENSTPLDLQGKETVWNLSAGALSTTVRVENGRANHSPLVMTEPVYRVKLNKTSVIKVQVTDEDGDFVRCARSLFDVGTPNETEGVTVNSDCTLEVRPTIYERYTNDTWISIHFSITDQPQNETDQTASSVVLSYVEAQISIHVMEDFEDIRFVYPTEATGTTFTVAMGTQWSTVVYAVSYNKVGIAFKVRGEFTKSVSVAEPAAEETRSGVYFSKLSWTPADSDVGTHSFCITAVDQNGGVSAEVRCYTLCVKVSNPCDVTPCLRGDCLSHENTYFCMCPVGFTGKHCETDINECELHPCVNGASCVNGANDFTCLCPPGYQGRTCEIDINECVSNPCQNNGVCEDGVNSFRCDCPLGFAGPDCTDSKGPKCFSCSNISSMSACQTVTTCQHSELCSLKRYLGSDGGYRFDVGCTDVNVCSGTTEHVTGDVCTQCCTGEYCNTEGCGHLAGLPPRSARGPLCFDCDDIDELSTCKTVTVCQPHEVCTIYGSRYTHFDSKCYNKEYPCGAPTSPGSPSYMCHVCCEKDFCNTNCTQQVSPAELVG